MASRRRVSQDVVLNAIEDKRTSTGAKLVHLQTKKGEIFCHYFPVHNAPCAALWVGGINNSNATMQSLYDRCAATLVVSGIASLKVMFRNTTNFEDSEHDIEAGIAFLQNQGINSVALIGHSFGGAVVIRVATQLPNIRTIVTLASQSLGAEGITDLMAECSILFLHGTDDNILSPGCSQYLHELTHIQKKLLLCPGADHNFEPLTEIVQQRVCEWIIQELKA